MLLRSLTRPEQRYPIFSLISCKAVVTQVLAQISPSRAYRIQVRRQWHCDGGARNCLVTRRNIGKSYVLCKKSHRQCLNTKRLWIVTVTILSSCPTIRRYIGLPSFPSPPSSHRASVLLRSNLADATLSCCLLPCTILI